MLAVTPTAMADEAVPLSGAPSTATPLERVNSYVDPSIARLTVAFSGRVWDRNSKEYVFNGESITLKFTCTGYVVNSDGYIATAGHCVDPNSPDVAAAFEQAAASWADRTNYYGKYSAAAISAAVDYFVDGEEKGIPDVAVTAQLSTSASGEDAYPAEVVGYSAFDDGDAALLNIAATDLQALPLAVDTDLGVGTEIVTIGFAGSVDAVTDVDLAASYKEGTISSQPTMDSGQSNLYEISAAMSGGMSGGPTVNLAGEVVAFNSFGISGESQQFNFVRPASVIAELMAEAGVANDLGEVATAYRQGLDAFFSGDKAAAITALEAVVDSQPGNELALAFLDRARQLADPVTVTPVEHTRILLVSGIGVAALALVGCGLCLVPARRGPSAQPFPTHGGGLMPR